MSDEHFVLLTWCDFKSRKNHFMYCTWEVRVANCSSLVWRINVDIQESSLRKTKDRRTNIKGKLVAVTNAILAPPSLIVFPLLPVDK